MQHTFLLVAAALMSLWMSFGAQLASAGEPPRYALYAMDTGLRGPDVPDLAGKVKLLKKLGYAGIGYTFNAAELPTLLDLLDQHRLELSAIYLAPFIDSPPEAALLDSVARLKGRTTRIELAFRSKTLTPSDPKGDAAALGYLTKLADVVGDSGPVISIYPHRNFWAERVEDGVRLARQLQRKNVGTHFNLVHWKWAPQKEPLETLLRDALPYLRCVTINGLDNKQGDRIVSLDQGDYDIDGFLRTLVKIGYRGPVGLQGYGVAGRSADHLGRSMTRWQAALARLDGAATKAGAKGGNDKAVTFTKESLGKLPPGWKAGRTGEGKGSVWTVVKDDTAPSKTGFALAQTAASPRPMFNLCVLEASKAQDVEVSVAFKSVAGKIDQGGGVMWRYQDAKNYYIARVNPLEENYRLYKVIDGRRVQLASAEEIVPKENAWHRLSIKHVGNKIECYFDGKKVLDAEDNQIAAAGQIGLWTKADAQTSFDELRIRDLGKKD
ncbi:MAG: sugar phosphate isomerase/epimerase [Gemmataceae bacterium]|nr:sugar phosphate isomerase/epimerase [Gemmataceae bacterium]